MTIRVVSMEELDACPLCGSHQVRACLDPDNLCNNRVICRVCGCNAPFNAWQARRHPVHLDKARAQAVRKLTRDQ